MNDEPEVKRFEFDHLRAALTAYPDGRIRLRIKDDERYIIREFFSKVDGETIVTLDVIVE